MWDCEKYKTSKDFSEVEKYFDTVKTEAEKIELIKCLFHYKGNKSPFWGVATSNEASQVFGPSPFEVVALFKISYLFYGNRDFALAMVLKDKNGKQNSKRSVKTAYKYYEKWFKKVKEIGLEEARKRKLDPLDGSGVSWY